MLQPVSATTFLSLAQSARRVVISREIMADRLTPIGIVEHLPDEMQEGAILESALNQDESGRYSLITFGIMAQLRVQDGCVYQRIGSHETSCTEHPFHALRELIAELDCSDPSFAMQGAIGVCTYDAIRLFETIPDRHATAGDPPEMLFNFYKTMLRYDHHQHSLMISVVVETGDNPLQDYQNTLQYIDSLIDKIAAPARLSPNRSKQPDTPVDTDINDAEFADLIAQAKAHIIAGDAFQIVLSRRFQKRYTATPLEIYRALRRVSPAPYMFYLPVNNGFIVGASPEKFISVHKGEVAINPIAGTRPRMNNMPDETIANSLLTDEKECAEHMMLVDLARNDLGVVCQPGSIKIRELLHVKHFSHISHITSTITGQLRDDKDAFDALAAAFPAGTLSGAPKISAMSIIDKLETSKRGMYGGIICRIDYHGNLDSCIAIRMAMLKEGLATVRTGAGIVYDSNPASEASETRQKARSMLAALSLAEKGLA